MRWFLLLIVCTGCTPVHAWERGALANPYMQLSPQLGDAFGTHVLSIQEGAIGGEGQVGAGCGCG